MYLFNKYLLSPYCSLSMVQGTEKYNDEQSHTRPCSCEPHSLGRKMDTEEIITQICVQIPIEMSPVKEVCIPNCHGAM